MMVRTALFVFVLAAVGEHVSSRAVDRPANNLSKESKLSGSDHVLATRYVIEHAAYFLVLNMLVLQVGDGDVKDSPRTAMK